VEANVSLCDLFATICDLTGTPLPDDHVLDSRSLVPLLEGDTERWHEQHRDETVSAYGDRCMIKHGDLKYFYHPEGDDLLFDLDRDDDETTNRIDEDRYADDVARFEERLAELGYGPNADPDYTDAGYETGMA
jgi:choline-sulfatase